MPLASEPLARLKGGASVDNSLKRYPYMKYILASIIILALIVISGILLYISISAHKETVIVINDRSFEIKGAYGGEYFFEDISSIKIKDEIPEVINEIRGITLKDKIKGEFELEELGECVLSVNTKAGPFVYVKVNGKYLIINFSDEAKTRELYYKLISEWEKMTQ